MIAARFWTTVVLFHAGLLWVGVRLGLRWWRAAAPPPSRRRWAGMLARDALLFALAAVLLAGAAWGARFTVMRLLSQALFGEGLLLAAWIAAVHGCRGQLARAVPPGAAVAALLLVYWDAYHREPYDLRVRHHDLDLSSGPAARRLRIVHITDIQAHRVGPHEERAIREAQRQRPDLVVLTGDYVHARLAPTEEQAAAALRALLRRAGFGAPLGVYATEGDAGLPCAEVFRGTGVECLVDEVREIPLPGGGSLALVGLATPTSHARDPLRLRRVVAAAPPAALRVVIGHRPDFVQAAEDLGVDLALAGHTHGGQVVIPLLGPPLTLSRLPRRYAGDLHAYRGIPLHVSRGVGMERGTAPQIRFLCPPEICVLDVAYGGGAARARASADATP